MAVTRTVSSKTTAKTNLDTSVLSNVTLDKSVAVTPGFATASTKTAGIAKATALFYKILWTDKGSNPLNTDEGTTLSQLYQSTISSIESLYLEVQSAVEDAFSQIQDYQERGNAPSDERITAVDIVRFNLQQSATQTLLEFGVDIFTASGQKDSFQIPSIVLV